MFVQCKLRLKKRPNITEEQKFENWRERPILENFHIKITDLEGETLNVIKVSPCFTTIQSGQTANDSSC